MHLNHNAMAHPPRTHEAFVLHGDVLEAATDTSKVTLPYARCHIYRRRDCAWELSRPDALAGYRRAVGTLKSGTKPDKKISLSALRVPRVVLSVLYMCGTARSSM
eukprot:COSAG02_NODE_2732_length_8141_cov_41.736011_5_plen_105_part_00